MLVAFMWRGIRCRDGEFVGACVVWIEGSIKQINKRVLVGRGEVPSCAVANLRSVGLRIVENSGVGHF